MTIKDLIKTAANKVITGAKDETVALGIDIVRDNSPRLAEAVIDKINQSRTAENNRRADIESFLNTEDGKKLYEMLSGKSANTKSNNQTKDIDRIFKEIEKSVKRNGLAATAANEKYSKLIDGYKKFHALIEKRFNESNNSNTNTVTNNSNTNTVTNNSNTNTVTNNSSSLKTELEKILVEKTVSILDKFLPSDSNNPRSNKIDTLLTLQLDEQKKTNKFLQMLIADDTSDEVRSNENELEANRRLKPLDISNVADSLSKSRAGTDIVANRNSANGDGGFNLPDIVPITYGKVKRLPAPSRNRIPNKIADIAAEHTPGRKGHTESLSKRPKTDVTDATPKSSKTKPSLLSRSASLLANPIARFAGGAALVGGAGYAGYKFGEYVNEKFLTDEHGGNIIANKLYDFFNPEQGAASETSIKPDAVKRLAPVTTNVSSPMLSPVTSSASQLLAARTERANKVSELGNKREQIQNITQQSQQPVVIAPQTTNVNGGGGSSNKILIASPVRNKESTFERVQMQDYWPRAA